MVQLPQDKKNRGFIALMIVLIFNAIGLITAISLLSQGGFFADNTNSFENMTKARVITDACNEEALLALKNNPSLVGSYSLNFADGSCSYTIINNLINTSIESIGVAAGYTRKTNIIVSTENSKLKILSWNEGF
jgi:hypothetical protein